MSMNRSETNHKLSMQLDSGSVVRKSLQHKQVLTAVYGVDDVKNIVIPTTRVTFIVPMMRDSGPRLVFEKRLLLLNPGGSPLHGLRLRLSEFRV